MFNTLLYIFYSLTGVYAVCLALNIVFSIKNKALLRYIFGGLQAVFLIASAALIFTNFLPESKNIFKIIIISMTLTFAGYFLSQYHANKVREFIGLPLMFTGTLCLFELLLPTFKLYKVSGITLTFSIIIYLALGAFYLFLVFKTFKTKQNLKSISLFLTVLTTIMACIIHFASIITIIYFHKIYALSFLLGTTLLVFSLLIEVARRLRKTNKKYIFLHELLLNLSVLFNAFAGISMILF